MRNRILVMVVACMLGACAMDEDDASDEVTDDTEEPATSETSSELITPVYLGWLNAGPWPTYCRTGEYPPPCPAFQQKWVAWGSCKRNRKRRGSVNSNWYFNPGTDWYWGDVIDCR